MESVEDSGNFTTYPEHAPAGTEAESPEPGHSKLRTIFILLLGIFAFFLFLALKLPEARIQNLVIAHLRILAQDQGLLFSAEKVRIGVIFGPALKLYNVELKAMDDERQVLKIPYARIRPKLLSLLTSTKKASITAELLDGDISGTIGATMANNNFGGPGASKIIVDLGLNKLDLSKSNLLKKFLQVDLSSGRVKGDIDVSLDFQQPQKSDGRIDLNLEKLVSPPQALYGFNLPRINIGQSRIDIAIKSGQVSIRTFDVGQNTSTDDIVAKITGGGTLDRALERTRIDAKANFRLSSTLIQSFPLLDALIGSARTPDGSYSYRLTGSFMGLEAVPGQ